MHAHIKLSQLAFGFDKLTVASGISNIGDGVMAAALPLLVASLTRDPLLVAGDLGTVRSSAPAAKTTTSTSSSKE